MDPGAAAAPLSGTDPDRRQVAAAASPWRALFDLVAGERRSYAWLTGALVVAALGPLTGPLLLKLIVDRAADGQATNQDIVVPAIAFLVLSLVAQLLIVAVSWFAASIAWTTANRLRIEMTEHVLGLDHEFLRSHTTGELIQRLDGDITSVSDFLSKIAIRLASVLVLVIGMTGVIFVLDWRLGLGALAWVVIVVVTAVRSKDRAVDASVSEMEAYATLYGTIEERLVAAEDLRANRASDWVMDRYVADSRAVMTAAVGLERAFIRFWGRLQILLGLGIGAAIAGSAALLAVDAITLGTTLVLVQYAFLLRKPMEEIVDQFDVVQNATGAMVRVAELRALRPSIRDSGTTSPPTGALSVELAGVGFDYGDGEAVLADVDLAIAPGRSVGFVGRSGGGKTTLTRLVLRLIEPTGGSLALGGVPIGEIPLEELRRRVAMVPQDVHVFDASIRDNVTLFDASIPDDDVRRALAAVGLERLADRSLVDDGDATRTLATELSDGEQQLLALARVWLREPDLVVLDEATARVDPGTEARLETAVAELIRGRTALIVAHRLSTLRTVDDICVVEDGRITEFGPRHLLEADPTSRFRRLLDASLEAAS